MLSYRIPDFLPLNIVPVDVLFRFFSYIAEELLEHSFRNKDDKTMIIFAFSY